MVPPDHGRINVPGEELPPVSYLPEVEVGEGLESFAALHTNFGLVPNVFRAQTLLPRLIEAQFLIVGAVLLNEGVLSRQLKELIALTIAVDRRNDYCCAMHHQALRSLGPSKQALDQAVLRPDRMAKSENVLLDFVLKLERDAPSVSADDVERLATHGFSDQHILEAVLTAALSSFFCTVSAGLGATPDFEVPEIPRVPTSAAGLARKRPGRGRKPFIQIANLSTAGFAPFDFLEREFGFIPNLFRAQTLRPDIVEADVNAIRLVLLPEDALSRVQKENILLVVTAAKLNTYCVAVHCELLRGLGISVEMSDQIAVDHRKANLPAHDEALLDFALNLATQPKNYGIADIERLRGHGFNDTQILEAIVMCGFTDFLHVSSTGLGANADFEPPPSFAEKILQEANLSGRSRRPMEEEQKVAAHAGSEGDRDLRIVGRVQRGDTEAFEDLVRLHGQRVYRTLLGILGQPDEAQDAAQEVFFNAFRNIAGFEGRSKFSTWLTRIAINRGLQRLRSRRPIESMDSIREGETFRPANVQPWQENPEQIYSRTEIRELIEREVMKLPMPYRVAVMLRDIQGLSTEEAAIAADESVASLKSRLLRGRLMLREGLARHFSKTPSRGIP